jgi:hypothetical protein
MREESIDGHVSCIPVFGILVLAMSTSAKERTLYATGRHSSDVFRESVVVGGNMVILKSGAEGLKARRGQRTNVHPLGHSATELQKIIHWESLTNRIRLLSKNVTIRIYKTIILPVVLYGCETWFLTLSKKIYASSIIYRCMALIHIQLLYRWHRQFRKLLIPLVDWGCLGRGC